MKSILNVPHCVARIQGDIIIVYHSRILYSKLKEDFEENTVPRITFHLSNRESEKNRYNSVICAEFHVLGDNQDDFRWVSTFVIAVHISVKDVVNI